MIQQDFKLICIYVSVSAPTITTACADEVFCIQEKFTRLFTLFLYSVGLCPVTVGKIAAKICISILEVAGTRRLPRWTPNSHRMDRRYFTLSADDDGEIYQKIQPTKLLQQILSIIVHCLYRLPEYATEIHQHKAIRNSNSPPPHYNSTPSRPR